MASQTTDDDIAYRRGVLLGLTVSEMVLLLVFVLLLTFGWVVWQTQDRLARCETGRTGRQLCFERTILKNSRSLKHLVTRIRALNPDAGEDTFDDFFRELQLAERDRQALSAEVAPLTDKARRFDELAAAVHRMVSPTVHQSHPENAGTDAVELFGAWLVNHQWGKDDRSDPQAAIETMVAEAYSYERIVTRYSAPHPNMSTHEVVAAMEQAVSSIGEIQQVLASYPGMSGGGDLTSAVRSVVGDAKQNAIAAKNCKTRYASLSATLGRGADYPPCWRDSITKKPAFLFDVVIGDRGLIVGDTDEPEHAAERAALPIAHVKLHTIQSVSEFLQATKELKTQSDARNCRHFVRVFLTNRSGRQFQDLERVEQHFYKLRVATPPAWYTGKVAALSARGRSVG
jgi:hypothetical protein